jgi:hypothetical protein
LGKKWPVRFCLKIGLLWPVLDSLPPTPPSTPKNSFFGQNLCTVFNVFFCNPYSVFGSFRSKSCFGLKNWVFAKSFDEKDERFFFATPIVFLDPFRSKSCFGLKNRVLAKPFDSLFPIPENRFFCNPYSVF